MAIAPKTVYAECMDHMGKGTALAIVSGTAAFRIFTAPKEDKLDALGILALAAVAGGAGSVVDRGPEAASLAAVGLLGYLLIK